MNMGYCVVNFYVFSIQCHIFYLLDQEFRYTYLFCLILVFILVKFWAEVDYSYLLCNLATPLGHVSG